MKTIKNIKTVKYDYKIPSLGTGTWLMLQYRGNTLLNVKKTSYKGISLYENDRFPKVFRTMKEAKQFCLDNFQLDMSDIDKNLEK